MVTRYEKMQEYKYTTVYHYIIRRFSVNTKTWPCWLPTLPTLHCHYIFYVITEYYMSLFYSVIFPSYFDTAIILHLL